MHWFLQFCHWTTHGGYNFVSGPLPDMVYVFAIGAFFRKHNCHTKGCWKLSVHANPENGTLACHKHRTNK